MSDWKDFVTNGRLGTERATPLDLPEEIADTLDASQLAQQSREARFLTRAGAYAAWRRAHWRPPVAQSDAADGPSPAASAGPETGACTPMSRASGSHLREMLGGTNAVVLPEWLEEAVRLNRVAPPELLPALLEYAREHPDLRPLILAAGGRRAAWLAEQNPAWNFAADTHPELWETGTRDAREAIFLTWRADNPAMALEKLSAAWKTMSIEDHPAFLEAMEAHLSDEDIPFLEAALDDRSKDARRIAGNLLLFLPASPLVARMTKRADALLKFQPPKLLRRANFTASLPDETDPNGARDGLDPRAFGLHIKLSARELLLIQIVGAVPLQHWKDTTLLPPIGLLKAVSKEKLASVVATGWALAALRENSAEWAEVLLDGPVRPHSEVLQGDPLMPLLPEPARLRRLLPGIHASYLSGGGNTSLPPEILAVRRAFPEGYLPERICRELLAALRRAAAVGIPREERGEIEGLLARIPPSMLLAAAENWPTDRDGVDGFVDLLKFRHNALAALSGI